MLAFHYITLKILKDKKNKIPIMIACDNIFFDKSKLKHLGKNVIIGKLVRIQKPYEI